MTMQDKFTKSITVRVTGDDFDLLRRLKNSRGLTPSQIIRDALLKHRVDLSNNLKFLNDDK
jgi:hypothetical protein